MAGTIVQVFLFVVIALVFTPTGRFFSDPVVPEIVQPFSHVLEFILSVFAGMTAAIAALIAFAEGCSTGNIKMTACSAALVIFVFLSTHHVAVLLRLA